MAKYLQHLVIFPSSLTVFNKWCKQGKWRKSLLKVVLSLFLLQWLWIKSMSRLGTTTVFSNGISELTNWHQLISWLSRDGKAKTTYACLKLRWSSIRYGFLQIDIWSHPKPCNLQSYNANDSCQCTCNRKPHIRHTYTQTFPNNKMTFFFFSVFHILLALVNNYLGWMIL